MAENEMNVDSFEALREWLKKSIEAGGDDATDAWIERSGTTTTFMVEHKSKNYTVIINSAVK